MGTHPLLTNSAVPSERLHQIAARKLTALGITVRLDGEQKLIGELTFRQGTMSHPSTRARISGSQFSVVGHDQLQFTEPPLAALGPIQFYDAPGFAALEERITVALQRRVAGLAPALEKLKKLRLEHRLDGDRLEVVGLVKAVPDSFELRGGPEGLWVSRILQGGGFALQLPPRGALLELAAFRTSSDLELHLADALPSLQALAVAAPVAAPATAPSAGASLQPLAPPSGALTLALLAQRLGPDAVFGLSNPGEISQSFNLGNAVWRFSATHLSGTTFKGSLVGPTGEKWSDKFDLLRFPGIPQLVTTALGTIPPATSSGAAAVAAPAAVNGVVPSHLAPQVDEVWLMNVLIEREEHDEVRYACTNVDGKPFGAPRILKSAEFREVFVQSGTNWRLLVLIEEVGADQTVVYRQLDGQRKPRGAPKRLAISILVTNFAPEATAY